MTRISPQYSTRTMSMDDLIYYIDWNTDIDALLVKEATFNFTESIFCGKDNVTGNLIGFISDGDEGGLLIMSLNPEDHRMIQVSDYTTISLSSMADWIREFDIYVQDTLEAEYQNMEYGSDEI
jgi:hypothetical protein